MDTAQPKISTPKAKWKVYVAIIAAILIGLLAATVSWAVADSNVNNAFHTLTLDMCNLTPQNVQTDGTTFVKFTLPVSIKNPSSTHLKVTLTLQMFIGDKPIGWLKIRQADLPAGSSYSANMDFSFSGRALDMISSGGSGTVGVRGLLSGNGDTFFGSMPFLHRIDANEVTSFDELKSPALSFAQCQSTILGG